MNLNEMQNLWNSPQNNLPSDGRQQLAAQFAHQMIRRRRFQFIWLINTFVWLTLITAVGVRNFVAGRIDPGLEWGVFPLLFLPWILAIHFWRQHLKPVARGELPVADSFRAALNANRTEMSHLKLAAGLLAVMVPLLAVVMQQLHAAGKVSGRELASMAVFFGAALLAGAGGMAIWYFARLQPRQKCLETLLKDLAD